MARNILVVVVGLMLLVAACGGSSGTSATESTAAIAKEDVPTDLAQVAAFTCLSLSGTTAATALRPLTKAIERVAPLGYTALELRGAMRAECPDAMTPLEADAAISALFGS
jgi:hypothetical protein